MAQVLTVSYGFTIKLAALAARAQLRFGVRRD